MKHFPQTQPNFSPEHPIECGVRHSTLHEVGTFALLNKSARVLVQLLHGLLHIRRMGVPRLGKESPVLLHKRALKLNRLCVALTEHLGVDKVVQGRIPSQGLLVTNHVSFLDIIFLGSLRPMVFVSKSEVATWPLVGKIATCAGTLYIERRRRADVSRVNIHLKRALEEGVLVTLFPEGTSSDGSGILPFQASLLQPAVDLEVPVTPGYLEYTGEDGERADDVAYFGDRDLAPCLMALLKRKTTTARLHCGVPFRSAESRKILTSSLHAEVVRLSTPLR